jgi:hypothetical protein
VATAVVAGGSVSFRVSVEDACGNAVTNYQGTVHFSSTDGQADLPAQYTFTAADRGSRTFTATLRTTGMQTLTLTDANGVTATTSAILVKPAAAARLVLTAPSGAIPGVPFSLQVRIVDAYGNTVPTYRGTVRFTSWGSAATLPAAYTFTPTDNGVHTFTGLVLRAPGLRSITVNDNGNLVSVAFVDVFNSGH